jgi:hypothetical protein
MGARKPGEGGAVGWRTTTTSTTTTATTTANNSPSFDRPSLENTAGQFHKSRGAAGANGPSGYIPNNSANGYSMPLLQHYHQQQYQQPMMSPGLRRNQPLQQRTGSSNSGDGAGAASSGGSLEMSWMGSGGRGGYGDNNGEGDDDNEDYYNDRKKDRSFYTRREHNSQRKSHLPLLFSDPKRILRTRLFCLRQNRRLHPCVRLVVFLFLAGSVCFTTMHLLFLGTGRGGDGLAKAAELRKSFDLTEQQLRVRKMLGRSSKTPQRVLSAFDVEAQNYSLHQWAVDTYDIRNSKFVVVGCFMLYATHSGMQKYKGYYYVK